ncbi:MAG: hypothetical protein B7X10_02295, partial [Burkholderiales bacterium 21-58-4]
MIALRRAQPWAISRRRSTLCPQWTGRHPAACLFLWSVRVKNGTHEGCRYKKGTHKKGTHKK